MAVGLGQSALCALTGISPSSMSKYFRGSAPIGFMVAGKLIAAMPSPHNATLLAAYLRDEIPEGLEGLVCIMGNATSVAQPALDPIPSQDELSGPARELIGYFARRMSEPAIADLLESTRRALEA